MRQQIKVDGEWVDGVPALGEWYRQQVGEIDREPVWQESRNIAAVVPEVFAAVNEEVTIDDNIATGFQSVYFGVTGNHITMHFDIVDGSGILQTQLDSTSLGYPPILALPVMKVAAGTAVDEVYFSTTLIQGVITVTGSFPASGNWQLTTARINAALAEIGATWTLEKGDVTFRISS